MCSLDVSSHTYYSLISHSPHASSASHTYSSNTSSLSHPSHQRFSTPYLTPLHSLSLRALFAIHLIPFVSCSIYSLVALISLHA
jgi:hypothetical protein